MKNKLLLFTCAIILSTQAAALDHRTEAWLYDHMVEVNRQWARITPDAALMEYAVFDSDRARIQKHLELVEQHLRNRDAGSLSPAQLSRRTHHLDVLHTYWQTGVFPTNHYHAHRQPYFRDNYDVLCAVGYLLWEDGQTTLVDRINRENNYAYIAELAAQYPAIGSWAEENGFTVEELAWIQPGYPAIQPDYKHWGSGLNTGGRINVMAVNGNAESLLFVAGSFDKIDGVAANSIAAWDGAGWHTLGNGVIGEIYDMEYIEFNNKLIVVGDFYLPGDPSKQNVALWDGNNWTGLQTGDMGGKVLTLSTSFYDLYIGGDFTMLNGQPAKNAGKAKSEFNGTYTWVFTDVISVDSTVRCITRNGDYVLFGGDFTHTSVNNPSGNQLTVNHMAYWYYDNWHTEFTNQLPSITAAYIENGYVVCGIQDPQVVLFFNTAGIWNMFYGMHKYATNLEDAIRGFFRYGDYLYAYGNISGGDFSLGSGLFKVWVELNQASAVTIANGEVWAAIGFQNSIYLAGNFDELHGLPYPEGMARIQLPPVGVNDQTLPVEVIASAHNLRLQHDALAYTTQLEVFDLQGRLIDRQTLKPGDLETNIDAGQWSAGLYVWHLRNQSGAMSGKWMVTP